MQISEFRWDDVRVFLALARARTLLGAGKRLGVNASTVGRRIDALERALGARLFDRTPDGAIPTAAAEDLVPAAERVERAAVSLAGAVEGFEREPEGLVRLTAPPGVADHFVAPALARLRRRYPRICIELDASVRYVDLTRREADLALRLQRPSAGDLIARRLGASDYAVLGSRALARRAGEVADAAALPWITWGPELTHLATARWVAAVAPDDAVALRTSSIGAQLSAAEAGAGAIVQPRIFATRSRLVEIAFAPALRAALPPLPTEELWLVGHRALRDVPRVAAVWQLVLEEFSALTTAR